MNSLSNPTSQSFRTIQVTREGRVGTITLDRPKALNALNAELMTEVVAAAEELDADRGIGAIVLTGSERAFAAGADIKEMAGQTYADMALGNWFAHWDRFTAVRTPIIAAVSGHALGGGCELAMMCDLVIASESARFGQPEINLGVFPGIGGTQRLTRAVGKAVAMDLMLTGRTMTAQEALAVGLVSRVLPTDELLTQVAEIAHGIAEKSLPVLYATKEAVNVAFESSLAEGIRFERRTFHAAFALEDRAEGMTAFVEKRKPDFKHR